MNADTEETRTTSTTPNEQAAPVEEQHASGRNPHVDTALTRLQEDPLRFAILAAGIPAVLMNWVTVSALGTVHAAAGVDYLVGKLYLLGILVLIAIEVVAREHRHDAWLFGGAALSVISIGSLLYIQARIDEAMASMGIFAGAVDASLGLGIYAAVVVALVITAFGYMNSEFDVNEYLSER